MQGRWWWWQMVETSKITTSSSCLNAREVVWWQMVETTKKNHLQLMLECEEGGVVAGGLKC